MKGNDQRLCAFTIMEVTVSMLIAAIVIGIAYTAYSIISRSYTTFKYKNDDLAVLNRVDELLRRDFGKAEMVTRSGNGLLIGDHISYEFSPAYIVRNSGTIDTFKVSNLDLQTVSAGADLIDEVSFTIVFRGERIPYHYRKTYSSADLIKPYAHAGN